MSANGIAKQIRGTMTEKGLLVLFEAGGSLTHDEFAAALGVDTYEAHQVFKSLDSLGLMSDGDYDHLSLNLEGQSVGQAVQKSHANGPDRWDAVERAIIADLVTSRTRNASDWGVEVAAGQPIEPHERTNAMQRLSEWGYLSGVSVAEADGFVRIDATPKASQVPGISGLLADFNGANGPSYEYNTTTSFGNNNTVGAFQAGGQGNTQHVVQIIAPQDRSEIIELVAGLLKKLDGSGADADGLRQDVEAIKEEAEKPSATREGIRNRVTQALITAGASQAGQLAYDVLAKLLGLVS